jgi:iron uptake system component EfeO
MRVHPLTLVATGLVAVLPAACSQGPVANSVTVTATETDCSLAKTDLVKGATEFSVANKGGRTTEFYVYDAKGRTVGEVEDIAPGVTRTLRVTLDPGAYQGACKAGSGDDGIRVPLTVGE